MEAAICCSADATSFLGNLAPCLFPMASMLASQGLRKLHELSSSEEPLMEHHAAAEEPEGPVEVYDGEVPGYQEQGMLAEGVRSLPGSSFS